MKTTSTISDEKGFWRHCEVAEMLFRMGVDPHTTHHIREAIREASKKLGRVRTKDKRRRAEYVSEAAEIELLNGRNKNLDEDHIVPISVIKKQILKLNRPNKSQIASIIRRWSSLPSNLSLPSSARQPCRRRAFHLSQM